MRAVKGNKVYTVDEQTKDDYIKSGFDVFDDEGNILQYGAGKTVSMDEYNKLKKHCEKLEKENENYKLSAMTVDQLKAYAAETKVELGDATTKDAILEKLKSEQGK